MTKLAQITTSYSTNRATGAGRITARFATGKHKGRRVTVAYDHAARDPHQIAARALVHRLYDVRVAGVTVTYVGTGNNGNTYDLNGPEQTTPEQTTPEVCGWFARCGRPATGTTPHPILGKVPTCDRCHDFATS